MHVSGVTVLVRMAESTDLASRRKSASSCNEYQAQSFSKGSTDLVETSSLNDTRDDAEPSLMEEREEVESLRFMMMMEIVAMDVL